MTRARVQQRPGTRQLPHVLLAASVLILSGCMAGSEVTPFSPMASPQYGAVTVVAVMAEGGLNVYHDDFALSPAENESFTRLADALGALLFTLSGPAAGTGQERHDHDEPRRQQLEKHVLYWVQGTRVFGIDFEEDGDVPLFDAQTLFSSSSHGSGVASRVATTAPGGAILLVKTNTAAHTQEVGHAEFPYLSRSLVEGTEWAAAQPWIDIMTYSIAYPGNPPDGGPLTPDVARFVTATRTAATSGKLVIAGAGNTAASPHLSPLAGPPWVISVGGIREQERGNDVAAAKAPDYASFYNVDAAHPSATNQTREYEGTSFAAPTVAGYMANAIHELREAAGVGGPRLDPGPFVPEGTFAPGSPAIGPAEVRAAFNASGHYWDTTEWSREPRNDTFEELTEFSTPILPVLAASQIGWGFIGGAQADDALTRLDEYARTGDARALHLEPATKGEENVHFMQESWNARAAYWHARMSE